MKIPAKTASNPQELTKILENWQALETATISHTTEVIAKTKNPLIRLLMEIIRQDSEMHYRVQQVLLDGIEHQAFTLTPEELGEIWDLIEKHADMEKQTIVLAEKALSNCRLFVQRHLLTYLIEDEKKHDRLLGQLEDFKRNIYPYA
jgi:Fe-S cluster biosynthesis and repair protein YggX